MTLLERGTASADEPSKVLQENRNIVNGHDASRSPEIGVCLVAPMPPPQGGISRWTETMCRSSGRYSVDILLVDTAPRWHPVFDRCILRKVLFGWLHLLATEFRLVSALLRRPSVVHIASSAGLGVMRDLVMIVSSRLLSVPVVYHLHFGRLPAIAEARSVEWWLCTLAIRAVASIVAITPETRHTIHRCFPRARVECIPNPIDLRELPAPKVGEPSRKTVLYLGWLLPSKGIEDLLAAWSRIAANDWELLLAGPVATIYQQTITARGVPANTRFVGELDHSRAIEFIAQCGILVLPSHTEGFPYVVLEAMSLGRPIVATSVGALPEMLSDGCGILVDPRDIDGLALALERLIQCEGLRCELGNRALEKAVREYGIDAVYPKYVGVWRSVTNAII